MMAIADAGGTKTDWRVIDQGQITQLTAAGINATSGDLAHLAAAVPEALRQRTFDHVHFYVAGWSASQKEVFHQALCSGLKAKNVSIYPDTLAAARALLGDQSGWVGILGTGSAAIHYDGHRIDDRKPSLGYQLGDEGSGVDLGKRLVRSFLRKQWNDKLSAMIRQQFPDLRESDVLTELYHNNNAKTFFSEFVPFLAQNQNNPQMYQLVETCFDDFFQGYFGAPFPQEISFSGSVAFNFGNILNAAARKRSIRIKRIIQSPIAGLTIYHQQHG